MNTRFGKFKLIEEVGRGGMATVYRAFNTKTVEYVAIKILHEHFALDSVVAQRFQRESDIISMLNHANIVSVLEAGHIEHRPYMVMPFYGGGTLATRYHSHQKLTIKEILTILRDVGRGLDYAHNKGIIHRDFKLQNILLDNAGNPVITDFGIAHLANSKRLTISGQFLGSVNYVAPELSLPNAHIDYHVDLYALGVIAYVLLTGHFPYHSDEPLETVLMHHHETPIPPSYLNKDLPASINDVLDRALAKKAQDRYHSAHEFVLDLSKPFVKRSRQRLNISTAPQVNIFQHATTLIFTSN